MTVHYIQVKSSKQGVFGLIFKKFKEIYALLSKGFV